MTATAPRLRILIVEDEPVVATDLQISLEGLGFQVAGIVDAGPEAVQAAERSLPDVVLMDVGLKGSMDGIAAAGEIRERWNIPVVFLTANTNEETLARASTTGAYGYLLKPFRTPDVNAAIILAMQQHRLARELFSEHTWLRTVLRSLTDSVIVSDTEGRVRYLNPAAEALIGCSLEESVHRSIDETYKLTTITNEPVEVCQLRKAILTRTAIAKDRFLLHTRDGRVIPIEDAAAPVYSGNALIGAVAVLQDISDRIRREHELEVEREHLEEQVQVTAQALGNTRAELRAFSGHLMTAQEEERRRVARELHDDLGQRTALAEMELERISAVVPPQNEIAHQVIRRVHEQITELSTALREVSHRLHPSLVEHLGLAAALRALVDEYCLSGGDASFVTHEVTPDLPRNAATALYRIAQEALRNASKHAAGAPVRITLMHRREQLQLKIEDAGAGFDPIQVRRKGGLGLLSMQERARLAGGSLLLRTRPGKGTLLLVRVPMTDLSSN